MPRVRLDVKNKKMGQPVCPGYTGGDRPKIMHNVLKTMFYGWRGFESFLNTKAQKAREMAWWGGACRFLHLQFYFG